MVRVPGKWILAILLTMGFFCWHSFQKEGPQSSRTLEDYWQETGLKLSELEELLQPQLCASSERYFLSCANAVVSMAQRLGLQVTPAGKMTSLNFKDEVQDSEKVQLASWKKFYQEKKLASLPVQVPFVQISRDLLARTQGKHHEAFYVGMGFNGFLSVFKDPHTYLTPMKYYQEVTSKPDGKTFSLGIILGREAEGFFLRKVQPRSAAEETGLKRGDRIVKINGKNVEALSLSQVLELLRSEPSQSVEISVLRQQKNLSFRLKRRMNSNEAVFSRLLPGKKKLGLLSINRFTYETCDIVKKNLEELMAQGARGLLVDLRDNPGGLVEEASCTASLFVGQRKMFVLKYLDSTKEEEVFYGEHDKFFDLPVALLINSETASSAELFAGILKDYDRAVIVGERSFGKGSFQEGTAWFKNPSLTLFQTQGLFYLPSGKSPQAVGVEPDVEVLGKTLTAEREAQMFLYPLQAPSSARASSVRKFDLKNCSEANNLGVEDLEISKAQSALTCISAIQSVKAGKKVEGQYDSNGSF